MSNEKEQKEVIESVPYERSRMIVINRSESLGELSKAVLKVRKATGTIKTDSVNNFFQHHKYASFQHIREKVDDHMEAADLYLHQLPSGNGLYNLLLHVPSGEFMECTFDIQAATKTPHAVGSAITYAKRYALVCMLGLIIADEDDDGNKGSNVGQRGQGSNTQVAAARNASQQPQQRKPATNTPPPQQPSRGPRPWLSEELFLAAKKRIISGERNVIEALEVEYQINKDYKSRLIDTEQQYYYGK